ncbi:MAG: efflux RND transporter periplasmic adaptor subunit, partial [Cyanobacteria bacterium P01_F01_bin.53]
MSVSAPTNRPLFKRPLPLVIALGCAGIVTAGLIALAISRRGPNYDIDALTVPVTSTPLTVRITASGQVQSSRTSNISPKTAGIVEEIYVAQGDRISQGQLIARMDSEQLSAQLIQSQASVDEAQAQLDDELEGPSSTDIGQASAAVDAARAAVNEARARSVLAQDEETRNQRLYAQGAISLSDLDRAQSENRSANAAVNQSMARLAESEQRLQDAQNGSDATTIAQAEARLNRAYGQLRAIELQLADTDIRAPFDGVVTQKFASEGSFVSPATAATGAAAASAAIVTIASGLEIVADVPEADIGRIKEGQSVEIKAEAYLSEQFEGEVKLIAPEAIKPQDTGVTIFEITIGLLTGADQLRPNMNTTVSFIGDRLEDALVVPAVSIITQGGETGVLVPTDSGKTEFEPVVLGSQSGDRIQILDGLEEGDRVFIDLPPGQRLENLTF